MQIIYEVTIGPSFRATDYADKIVARQDVETVGSGRIVTFVRDFDGRDRSCAMEVFENGEWRGISIHG